MPRMIPSSPRQGTNGSERRVFGALETVMDRPDWVVFHGLVVRRHVERLQGEADFVVVVPGRGVVVIEVKNPRSVDYHEGQWTLDGTPHPGRSPLEQVDGAVRSIRSYLLHEGVIAGDEPFARLLWFTSIGRHHFGGRAPSDLSFFEWELAWADDLGRAREIIEDVLDRHIAWHDTADAVRHHPEGVTPEKVEAMVEALTRDFSVVADHLDARREAEEQRTAHLAEQRFALELLETNPAVYFDGPAGTGKSELLIRAARNAVMRRRKTLLTCWNVVMAQHLRDAVKRETSGPLAAADLATVMARVAGIDAHPEGASDAWFHEELPARALAALREHPERGGYATVVVDEFQDIAGSPLLVELLVALGTPDAHYVWAGDMHQQIMRTVDARVDPLTAMRALLPHAVHARITRNCRQAPRVVTAAERYVGRDFGLTHHRIASHVDGGVDRVMVTPGGEVGALAAALKDLVHRFGPDRVTVLSPWASQSLAARVVAGEEAASADARWLRATLGEGAGKVAFGSVFKLKGIEADAVVLTDIGPDAQAWAQNHHLDWSDLLYVALTRATSRAVVLEEEP